MDSEVNQEDLMANSGNSDQQMAEHLTLAMECSSDVIRSTENHEEPTVSDVTSTVVPKSPPTQSQFETETNEAGITEVGDQTPDSTDQTSVPVLELATEAVLLPDLTNATSEFVPDLTSPTSLSSASNGGVLMYAPVVQKPTDNDDLLNSIHTPDWGANSSLVGTNGSNSASINNSYSPAVRSSDFAWTSGMCSQTIPSDSSCMWTTNSYPPMASSTNFAWATSSYMQPAQGSNSWTNNLCPASMNGSGAGWITDLSPLTSISSNTTCPDMEFPQRSYPTQTITKYNPSLDLSNPDDFSHIVHHQMPSANDPCAIQSSLPDYNESVPSQQSSNHMMGLGSGYFEMGNLHNPCQPSHISQKNYESGISDSGIPGHHDILQQSFQTSVICNPSLHETQLSGCMSSEFLSHNYQRSTFLSSPTYPESGSGYIDVEAPPQFSQLSTVSSLSSINGYPTGSLDPEVEQATRSLQQPTMRGCNSDYPNNEIYQNSYQMNSNPHLKNSDSYHINADMSQQSRNAFYQTQSGYMDKDGQQKPYQNPSITNMQYVKSSASGFLETDSNHSSYPVMRNAQPGVQISIPRGRGRGRGSRGPRQKVGRPPGRARSRHSGFTGGYMPGPSAQSSQYSEIGSSGMMQTSSSEYINIERGGGGCTPSLSSTSFLPVSTSSPAAMQVSSSTSINDYGMTADEQANERMDAYIEKFSNCMAGSFDEPIHMDTSNPPTNAEQAICMYIDYLVMENERRTRISSCNIVPLPVEFPKEDYYREVMCQPIVFPTTKFRDWLKIKFNVDIEIADSDGQTVSETTYLPSAQFTDSHPFMFHSQQGSGSNFPGPLTPSPFRSRGRPRGSFLGFPPFHDRFSGSLELIPGRFPAPHDQRFGPYHLQTPSQVVAHSGYMHHYPSMGQNGSTYGSYPPYPSSVPNYPFQSQMANQDCKMVGPYPAPPPGNDMFISPKEETNKGFPQNNPAIGVGFMLSEAAVGEMLRSKRESEGTNLMDPPLGSDGLPAFNSFIKNSADENSNGSEIIQVCDEIEGEKSEKPALTNNNKGEDMVEQAIHEAGLIDIAHSRSREKLKEPFNELTVDQQNSTCVTVSEEKSRHSIGDEESSSVIVSQERSSCINNDLERSPRTTGDQERISCSMGDQACTTNDQERIITCTAGDQKRHLDAKVAVLKTMVDQGCQTEIDLTESPRKMFDGRYNPEIEATEINPGFNYTRKPPILAGHQDGVQVYPSASSTPRQCSEYQAVQINARQEESSVIKVNSQHSVCSPRIVNLHCDYSNMNSEELYANASFSYTGNDSQMELNYRPGNQDSIHCLEIVSDSNLTSDDLSLEVGSNVEVNAEEAEIRMEVKRKRGRPPGRCNAPKTPNSTTGKSPKVARKSADTSDAPPNKKKNI